MAYKLIVTRSAQEDLDSIVAYLVNKLFNMNAAVKLLDETERHYNMLEENPFLYARCAQSLLRPGGYRKIVIGSYLMIHHVDEASNTVYIDRLFNELQDYADKL